MGIVEAIALVNGLMNLAMNALGNATAVSDLIQRRQAEGKAITPEDLDAIVGGDDASRKVLVEAIAKAKASQP